MVTSQHGARNALLPTTTQAMHSTYASRLRTGTTLLMQPILAPSSIAAVATRTTRRGGVVNYADPGSGDEFPDAGALDSDDSDFGGGGGGGGAPGGGGGGGTRQGGRAPRLSSRTPAGSSVFDARGGGSGYATPVQQSNELDKSYLGEIPPARFITARPLLPTRLEY